jgi:diaminohydroxyphosphoribosylaminopyrimidine deaminase / 5-amino-6-(5-phosphoribosylamino)uracil reductase
MPLTARTSMRVPSAVWFTYPERRNVNDEQRMHQAIDVARAARLTSSPNPGVGCVIVAEIGEVFTGATEPPGGRHAEIVALDAAKAAAQGATLYTTLEPCSHYGRTGPCADAIIASGVRRVVVGVEDPDPKVAGQGIARLRDAGLEVTVGVGSAAAEVQLASYLHHRRTGRPLVVLKLAASLDGRTAAPDGTSQWITGEVARRAVHQLRAESDAIIVGAGTVRADDPSLTVRHVDGPDPQRIVLGTAPTGAKVHPCRQWNGPLDELLDALGAEGVLQVLVEGGAAVAASFHHQRLVDRYVLHLAPALFGGDDGRSLFAGAGAPTIADLWRGRVISTRALGDDLEVVLAPTAVPSAAAAATASAATSPTFSSSDRTPGVGFRDDKALVPSPPPPASSRKASQ